MGKTIEFGSNFKETIVDFQFLKMIGNLFENYRKTLKA